MEQAGVKVLIGTPSFDHVSADFAMSLGSLLGTIAQDRTLRREFKVSLFNPKGTMVANGRNQCVDAARDMGATHLLFLDSDMVFPPDTLNRLASHHVPIVGGDYPSRYAPFRMNGRPEPHQGNHYHESIPRGLIPMLTLPFGCILIKMRVFDDILTHRATLPSDHPLGGPGGLFQYHQGAGAADTLSEDSRFCAEARTAGHVIYMDPIVTRTLGHVGATIHRYTDGLGAPPR